MTMGPGPQKHRHHRSPLFTMSADIVASGEPGPPAAGIVTSADPTDYRYPGGKSLAGVHQWIVSLLPSHVFYAEPFVGKGAIFRNKPPALRSYLIDCDSDVIAWWRQRADPGAIVQRGDGIRWVELAAEWAGPDLLIYADPPYLLSTRSKRRIYRHEMTVTDHQRLLHAALRCQSSVVLSGYGSDLYDRMLRGWHRVEHPAITRGGVMRTEVLWLNYDPGTASPALAMEYSGLGSDFRERERVSRKINRWVKRIQGLHRHERRALLLAILDAERESPSPGIVGSDEVAGRIVTDGGAVPIAKMSDESGR